MNKVPRLDKEKIPQHVLDVLAKLRELGHQAFLVGGGVRDLLLGATPKDFDVATSAKPPEVQAAFRKVIPTGIQHGTVTVLTRGHPIEVTTFRTEGEYLDARRPSTVEFHTAIELDLARRDFTINAMAYDPLTDALVDPFGGQADLSAGRVRCVGEARARFLEDGLRPLRAVRFACVLGFSLEEDTERAISDAIVAFRKVAPERIREEFSKLLMSTRSRMGLELLRTTGLLAVFLPELAGAPSEVWESALRALEGVPPTLELRLAVLLRRFEGQAAGLVSRLKYPNKVADAVVHWVRCPPAPIGEGVSEGQVRRYAAAVGREHLEPVLAVEVAVASGEGQEERAEKLRAFTRRARQVLEGRPPLEARALALRGTEIMRILGVGPSPAVGEATRYLLDKVLDDPAQNSVEGLTRLLEGWARRPD